MFGLMTSETGILVALIYLVHLLLVLLKLFRLRKAPNPHALIHAGFIKQLQPALPTTVYYVKELNTMHVLLLAVQALHIATNTLTS